MDESKTAKLERAGWKLGTPKEFLGLTDEEAALIEIKLALARGRLRKSDASSRRAQRFPSRSEALDEHG